MGENSKIQWTDHTFNPWIGCTKISPGCANCYAETLMDTRCGRVKWGKGQPRSRTSEANWKSPLRWNDQPMQLTGKDGEANRNHRRTRVFCASLADWLDDEVPIEWLVDLLDLIRRTPNLDWLLLTKRPEDWANRILQTLLKVEGIECCEDKEEPDTELGTWLNNWLGNDEPSNVWIGTTVENQEMADKRIPLLLDIPARVRFLSCEPLLGALDLSKCLLDTRFEGRHACTGVHWVICGGESGPHARPMHPDWSRSLRDQCRAAGVPFFFKQWGEWAIHKPASGGDLGGDLRRGTVVSVRPFESDEIRVPGCAYMRRVGKKAAGRLLDGREWSEFPEARS